jgi:DNA polymerase elongation subunit (family B)
VKLQIFDVDYSTDPLQVQLYGRDREGTYKLIDENFRPYFYALPEEELGELNEEIGSEEFETDKGEELEVLEVEEVEKTYKGRKRKALKIYTDVPASVPKLKNQIWDLEPVERCLEFDIPFYRRYLIDKGIRPGSGIEVEGEERESENFDSEITVEGIFDLGEDEGLDWNEMSFDLEVVDGEIVMASFKSGDFEKVLTVKDVDLDFCENVEGEKGLLERFLEIIEDQDVDILTGYNTDEFDFPELREAAERNGIELDLGRNRERMKFNRRGRFKGARIKGRMHLDLYPFVTHIMSPGIDSETLDLDSVAEELLGMNKDDLSWEEMKEIWKSDKELEKFAEYALKDAQITYQLSREISPQILELSRITGLIPFDTCRLTYGQLTENYLLREAYNRDIFARNRPSQSKRNKRDRDQAYEGGFVYTPEEGLYEDIAVFDFRSLYPTVMVAHNISPDTLNLDECDDRFELEEFDYDFCQDKQGFFPELVENLVSSRYNLKEKMKELDEESSEYSKIYNRQNAQKILANSFYGYLGYSGARWYSKESAEATTYLGREYIKDAIDIAQDRGLEMIYGDTDSLMLSADNIKEKMDDFLEEVNSELPEFMELEFEGFFRRGLFTSKESGEGAKKKYALIDGEGNLKITGFEQVRRDWSPIAKRTQKNVLRKVLEDDVDGAVEEVKETIQRLKSGEVDVEDLKIYTTLTKEPEEYDSTSPHVEAAKKAIERGKKIEPETTIDYVITRKGDSISDKAEITEHAESYDADYYIENQVLPVTHRVLKVFGYTEDQLKGKGKQSGLGRF